VRKGPTKYRLIGSAALIGAAIVTGLIVDGPGYAVLAGAGAALGILIAVGIRRLT